MVICVEVTDDDHPPCKRIQPHIVDLAREISQIPFFRVKIDQGRTFDQVRTVHSEVLNIFLLYS